MKKTKNIMIKRNIKNLKKDLNEVIKNRISFYNSLFSKNDKILLIGLIFLFSFLLFLLNVFKLNYGVSILTVISIIFISQKNNWQINMTFFTFFFKVLFALVISNNIAILFYNLLGR